MTEKYTKEQLMRMINTQSRVEDGLRRMLEEAKQENLKLDIENEHLRDVMETNYTATAIVKKWKEKSQEKIDNVACGEWVSLDPPLCKWALAEVLMEATEEYKQAKETAELLRNNDDG